MIAKKIICLFLLSISFSSYNIMQGEESQLLSVKIINEVADITDDVANLIVNCKTEKNPDVTKTAVINLIQHIASITQAIIEKKSQRSQYKFIDICDIPEEELLDIIANNIIKKANKLERE